MSRRKGKGRNRGQHVESNNAGQQNGVVVSHEEWEKYQRFCRAFEEIEGAASEIQYAWTEHQAYIWSCYREQIESEDMEDNLLRLVQVIRSVKYDPNENRREKKNKKKKRQWMEPSGSDYVLYQNKNFAVCAAPNPPAKAKKSPRIAMFEIEDISQEHYTGEAV